MNTRADIEQMLNGYFARFPEDRTKKTTFTDFVAAAAGQDTKGEESDADE